MTEHKKHLEGELRFTGKLSAVEETCGQSLWVLVVVAGIVVVASLLGLFLEERLMFIVNLVLGVIGVFVGTLGIKRIRKAVLK